MNSRTLFLIALAGCGVATAAMPETDLKASKVAIFKNGYGFVTLQGELGEQSSTRLNSLPVPSIGTFWVQGEDGVKIKSLVSELFDYEEAEIVDISTLAAANAGSQVEITYSVLLPRGQLYRQGGAGGHANAL